MHSDSGFGLLAGLSAGLAARIGSLARDVRQSDEPLPEGNITLFYDFKYGGGGLHKRGTATLSITRRHVRAHDDLLRTEPQSNESGTLRVT
jgi:hypothetical protein